MFGGCPVVGDLLGSIAVRAHEVDLAFSAPGQMAEMDHAGGAQGLDQTVLGRVHLGRFVRVVSQLLDAPCHGRFEVEATLWVVDRLDGQVEDSDPIAVADRAKSPLIVGRVIGTSRDLGS